MCSTVQGATSGLCECAWLVLDSSEGGADLQDPRLPLSLATDGAGDL